MLTIKIKLKENEENNVGLSIEPMKTSEIDKATENEKISAMEILDIVRYSFNHMEEIKNLIDKEK